jgi:5-methylcytosine-specific restriction endonuclease McrA
MSSDYRANGTRRTRLRRAVIHRDGPDLCCHLCHAPIDLTLKFPHPYSFSLDHYIPQSKGGDVWALDNCLPAHLTHNQSRGNRQPTTQRHTPPPTVPASRQW